MRIALKYRTPVILLTDGYLANGAEPWLLPDVDALPDISVPFATEPNHGDEFWPYLRDPETLARPWAIPGTPGLMHRIGGIEKEDGTGNVNYDPENHERWCACGPRRSPASPTTSRRSTVDDDDGDAELLVLGWGSTWGVASQAVAPGPRRGHEGGARPPDAPEPVPGRPRRGAARGTQGARARDEPRPAVEAGAGRVPRRRAELHQGAGPPVPRRRDRDRRSWR